MPRSDDPLSSPTDAPIALQSAREPRIRNADALALALLVVVALLAFWPVTRNRFVNWDDTDMVVQNPALNPPSVAGVARFWREPHIGLYVPLTYTMYAGLAAISASFRGPMDPRVFHAASLLLHVGSTIFVWLILRRLIVAREGSQPITDPVAPWLGAAIFAVHPIQTEAVAWVASFNTVLSGALALAAMWCYLEHATRPRTLRWFLAATLLFVLALFAKPSAVVAPLLVVPIELLLRRPIRAWWKGMAFWLGLSMIFAVVARQVQPATIVPAASAPRRLLVAADAASFYLQKILFPRDLAIDYGRTPARVLGGGGVLPNVLVVLALLAAAWTWRRRESVVTAGIAIFLLALLPVLGLVPFDFQMYSTVADRYAYPSMLGVALIVACITARARGARLGMVACVGFLMVLTMRQATVWHDTYALANHALTVNPLSAGAHKVLAATYAADDRPIQAADHYRAALALRGDDPEVLFNYANLLLRQREYDSAIKLYERARALHPRDTQILKNLAVAFASSGKLDAATQVLEDALAVAPQDPGLHQNLEAVQRRMRAQPTTTPTTSTTGPA